MMSLSSFSTHACASFCRRNSSNILNAEKKKEEMLFAILITIATCVYHVYIFYFAPAENVDDDDEHLGEKQHTPQKKYINVLHILYLSLFERL